MFRSPFLLFPLLSHRAAVGMEGASKNTGAVCVFIGISLG